MEYILAVMAGFSNVLFLVPVEEKQLTVSLKIVFLILQSPPKW